jgi:S1-C subfamily serine protease
MSEDFNPPSVPPFQGPQNPMYPPQDPPNQPPGWGTPPMPPMPPGSEAPGKKPRSLFFLWGIPIGIVLALILLLLFYKFYYPGLSKEVAVAKIDPAGLNNANVLALQSEIDRYKQALDGDVCLYPPISESVPLFRRDPGFVGTLSERDITGTDGSNGTYPAVTPDTNSLLPEPINPSAGDLVEDSTVFIISDSSDSLMTGTGFFINNKEILTNRHVVENAQGKDGNIWVINKSLGAVVPVAIRIMTNSNEPYSDYAILELPSQITSKTFLKLNKISKRADRVGSWGYPGLNVELDPKFRNLLQGDATSAPEIVYTNGVISVIQDIDNIPIINHTAEVSHGNSGGPLVDQDGNVVGINTIIYVDPESNRQVNIALGSTDIINFLQNNRIQYEESKRS